MDRTRKYVKTLLDKSWLASHAARILNNEGGFNNIVQQALIKAVEANDFNKGLKMFAHALQEEYQSSNNRNKAHHTKWKPLFLEDGKKPTAYLTFDGYRFLGDTPSSDSLSGEIHPKVPFVEQICKTDDERLLLITIAGLNGAVRSSFDALGWDHKDGWRMWYRLYRRQRRIVALVQQADTKGT